MSADKLASWISKLSQFETELERLHVALSIPQKDPARFEQLKRLADYEVPKTIAKIQSKIAALQPPKPPTDAPPRFRGRRHHRSFIVEGRFENRIIDEHESSRNIPDRPGDLIAASDSFIREIEDDGRAQHLDLQLGTTGERTDDNFFENESALSTSRTPSETEFGSSQSCLSQSDKQCTIPISKPKTNLHDLSEATASILGERRRDRTVHCNKVYQETDQSRMLITKLDLRERSCNRLDKEGMEPGHSRSRDVNRSFHAGLEDGRMPLAYLAALSEHELYEQTPDE